MQGARLILSGSACRHSYPAARRLQVPYLPSAQAASGVNQPWISSPTRQPHSRPCITWQSPIAPFCLYIVSMGPLGLLSVGAYRINKGLDSTPDQFSFPRRTGMCQPPACHTRAVPPRTRTLPDHIPPLKLIAGSIYPTEYFCLIFSSSTRSHKP